MATNTYLVLTDGTTTVTIADGSGGSVSGNYRLVDESWSPAVAGLRRSQLGGAGPYEDVSESMEIAVSGSTVGACMSYISTVTNLLQQSERWYRGENVSPVLIKYSPKGAPVSSAASPLQAAILGRAGDNFITIPPTLESNATYKAGVQLNFVRRGQWVYQASTSSASAASNPTVITVPLTTNITTPSTFEYYVAGLLNVPVSSPGLFVITAPSASYFDIFAGSAVSVSAPFTHVSGSAASAYGGSVVRFTPANTSEQSISWDLSVSLTNTSGSFMRRIAVFVIAANNSATTSFSMRMGFRNVNAYYSTDASVYTQSTVIDTSTTSPRVVPLGIIHRGDGTLSTLLVTASSASGTLDVNYIAIVGVDDQRVSIHQMTTGLNWTITGTSAVANFNYNPITDLAPSFSGDGRDGTDAYGQQIAGYSYTTPVSSGSTISFLTLGTAGSKWVLASSAGSVRSLTASATRFDGYLTPV